MSKIKIVTDSTSYMDQDFIQQHNITVVPLSVHFENKVTEEGFVGEFQTFFDRLATSQDFPSTSQPPVGAFVKVYEEILNEDVEIIVLTISSKLSGTYSSAHTAGQFVDKNKISIIDSESTASNLKAFVQIALEMADQGYSRKEIVERIETQKKRSGICLTVDTLEYLKRGGRLSNTGAFFANLLNIRPVIALVDGKLEGIAKVRGKKKAIDKMINEIPESAFKISICHIFAEEEAFETKNMISTRFPEAEISIDPLGPVVGAHLGPQALGICYLY
ncbi:DegV family protein [Serpentinicella sp. ANB-PHB4]|uniref:DegV family protein n=1 Tax=Serpentinicella sp. ANB-PHB4 TaxID=3074076 RepID=UPI0028659573|nr:DegV family protein [Serpentinicella sp. ANB-PHB4]MDR5658707.1 DegV family protein [Serpentinicella sp. ANB-PHB4]